MHQSRRYCQSYWSRSRFCYAWRYFFKKTFFVNLKLFISYFFLRNACWSWPVRRRSYWEGWEKIQAILWYELCHCYAKTQRYALAFYLFTFLISCLFTFWTITICFPFYLLGGVAEYRASEGKTVEVPYRGIFSAVCSNTYKNCNDCNRNSIIAIKMHIVLINCIFFRWCSWYYARHFGRFAISLYLCWCRTCQRNAQKNYFYPCDSTIE